MFQIEKKKRALPSFNILIVRCTKAFKFANREGKPFVHISTLETIIRIISAVHYPSYRFSDVTGQLGWGLVGKRVSNVVGGRSDPVPEGVPCSPASGIIAAVEREIILCEIYMEYCSSSSSSDTV